MPSAVYETVIELTAKGDLGGKIDGMMGGLGKLGDGLTDFTSNLSGAFTGAIDKVASLTIGMGKLAAVGVAGGLAYGVASLNAGLEKTQVSLAAIFNANGAVQGMGQGMELAGNQMSKMRKDAADLPGEFSDLVGIFRASAIPGLRNGMSIDQIRELSANTMAAGAASGLQMDMVAREMGMLLSGRAGAHNVLGSQIFGLSGDSAKKFNNSSGEDRVKTLNKQLEKFGEAKAQFGKTWEGVTSTLADNAKSVIGAATLPLFNSLKGVLGGANAWFDAHQQKIMFWAEFVGHEIDRAFHKGEALITEWWPAMYAFVDSFEDKFFGVWRKVEPIVERIGGMIGKMMKDPEGTWGKMANAGKAYAALKITAPLGSGITGAISQLGGGGGAELAAASGIGAVAVAALAVSVYGAIDILTDASNSWNGFANDQVTAIKGQFTNLTSSTGDLWTSVRPLVDLMGADLLWSIRLSMEGFSFLAWQITALGDAISWTITTIKGLLPGGKDPKLMDDVVDGIDRKFEIDPSMSRFSGAIQDLNNTTKKETKAPKGHGTHIDKVEITVSGQTDPSRVARIVSNHLTEIARNPKASRFSPNYSGSR